MGFSVVLGFSYYYLTQKMIEEAMGMYSFEPKMINISKHRKIERNDKLLILGEIKNIGENKAKDINVTVDLYLGDEFVKQCDEGIRGGVPAGETRNFEISCGGGRAKNPIVEHDSYKIYVSGY
ncbi:MAG: hypothetical protein KBT63_08370 [Porticoccaceae bacterium]|nr:hypothetical protein [Porticoccaceae bacterium]